MKTYMIENLNTNMAIEYYSEAAVAKRLLKKLTIDYPDEMLRMVKIVGPRYAEGWHNYYCYYDINKNKFTYNKR